MNTGKLVVRATHLAESVWEQQVLKKDSESAFPNLSTDIVGEGEGRPVVSETFLFGVKEHEAELQNILKNEAHRTVVLFPASSAVQASEFFQSRLAEQKETSDRKGEESDPSKTPWDLLEPQNIVLIDGTWAGVQSMHRRIPKNIPRVIIPLPGETKAGWCLVCIPRFFTVSVRHV